MPCYVLYPWNLLTLFCFCHSEFFPLFPLCGRPCLPKLSCYLHQTAHVFSLFYPPSVSFTFFVDWMNHTGCCFALSPPPPQSLLCPRWLTVIHWSCPCASPSLYLSSPSLSPSPLCLGEWWRWESWLWWLAALWVSSYSSQWPARGSPPPSHQAMDGCLPPNWQSGTPGVSQEPTSPSLQASLNRPTLGSEILTLCGNQSLFRFVIV